MKIQNEAVSVEDGNERLSVVDVVIEIRDLIEGQLQAYRERVLTPHHERLRELTGRLGRESCVAFGSSITDTARASIKAIVAMDEVFLERLTLDGPQEASFCPHSLYLFDWRPVEDDMSRQCLRSYMDDYRSVVAAPLLESIQDVERRTLVAIAREFAAGSSEAAIAHWSDGVRAINRCARFFARRAQPDVEPWVFFQDV